MESHRSSLAFGALALAFAFAWSRTSAADVAHGDLHDPSVSPDSSTGVNPGTTRGLNRSTGALSPPVPTMESTYGRVGTTTTTGAIYPPFTAEGLERDAPAVEAEERRPNRTLLLTGGAILVGSYAASSVVAATVGTEAEENLYIPVVGPWLALGERSCPLGECGLGEDINVLGLIASGVAQGGGLLVALSSFFISERRETTRPTVEVVPVALGRGSTGVGAAGTF